MQKVRSKRGAEADVGAGPWLQLAYQLPSEPSRHRVFVWRKVKSLGALFVRDGVCIAPGLPFLRSSLAALAAEISGWGNWAELFELRVTSAQRSTYVDALNSLRRAEYDEVLTDTERLADRIERHLLEQDFAFQEVEELAEELDKLRRWQAKVSQRDFFGCSRAHDVEKALVRCARSLDRFESAVAHGDKGTEQAGGVEVVPRAASVRLRPLPTGADGNNGSGRPRSSIAKAASRPRSG